MIRFVQASTNKKFKVYVKDGDTVKVVRLVLNLSIKRDDPIVERTFVLNIIVKYKLRQRQDIGLVFNGVVQR